MSAFSVTLPSGQQWMPTFVQDINEDTCIGCGRCFKVVSARRAGAGRPQ